VAPGGSAIAARQPTSSELAENKGALLGLFDRMLPVVDGIADGFRFATLLGLALVAWVFVWMFHLNGYQLTTALLAAAVLSLPIPMLLRFWWGLEGLKKLPTVVANAVGDVRNEVRERVQAIRAPGKRKLGLLSSARRLWELRDLVGEARRLLGSYVRVGTLFNPLSLLLGFLSLLCVPGLLALGIALLALQAF
jgi:hypothetical protein